MSDAFKFPADQKKQFLEEGYFILPAVIPPAHVQLLRGECQFFIDSINREMDEKKTDVLSLNRRNSRYFIANQYKQSARMHEFIFSETMAEVCRATLGPDVWLFWEQWVIKCAEQGAKFSWHQDSAYVPHEHKPYLTCWCPLDDVDENNGTIYVMPYSRAGTKEIIPHVKDPELNDLVGYHGEDPGIPIVVPAGSVVGFSSRVLHRSGANKTPRMRRVYLPQYSAEPIMSTDGGKPIGLIDPFLSGNKIVAQFAKV